MADTGAIEFFVLGPLEVTVDGQSIPLGGAKQRAVLALLLLHSNQVVPIERIVDEVWGDEPPSSARHTVEANVSRLRSRIGPHGPSLVREGGGYRLDLGGARLDMHAARELLGAAAKASEAEDEERAAALAQESLDLWRGPALRDALLRGPARAEVEELDELRLRVVERLVDAELALGRHEDAAALLRPLVDEYPYRERFVAQLMLALYRSGRPAEALEVYERCREALDRDLGLRPSAELQRLSGEIVRHDPRLAPPGAPAEAIPARGGSNAVRGDGVAAVSRRRRHLSRRNTVAALLAIAAAVATVAVFAIGMGSGSDSKARGATPHVGTATRVGLVLPRQPATSDDVYAPYVDGLLEAKRLYGIQTTTILVDPSAQQLDSRARKELEGLDLVLLAGPAVHERFVEEVPTNPDTHFVFLDPSPEWDESQVNEFPNSTDIFFIEGPASFLAGYMSALMEKRRGARPVVVSIVAGKPDVDGNLVAGFEIGARAAVPGAVVLKNYSSDFTHPPACENLANRQIDAGSRVVFATAGTCSLGALSAAAIRGVWGVGLNLDQAELGPHVLTSVVKHVDRAAAFAIRSYLNGTLDGGSLDIGIERQAVGITDISTEVPADIRSKVAREAERRAKKWRSWSTPQVRQGTD